MYLLLTEEEFVPLLTLPLRDDLSPWVRACATLWLQSPVPISWISSFISPEDALFLLSPSDQRLDAFFAAFSIPAERCFLWLWTSIDSVADLDTHPRLPTQIVFPDVLFHMDQPVVAEKIRWLIFHPMGGVAPWFIPRNVIDALVEQREWLTLHLVLDHMSMNDQPIPLSSYMNMVRALVDQPFVLEEYLFSTRSTTSDVNAQWKQELYNLYLDLLVMDDMDLTADVLNHWIFQIE